ncbi:hypothetical protein F3P66_05655 [Agrobacterium fabrum]|uniref:Uncharacterized protein n=1 Tax=Agrobacterium fabrum (strain C58 / ATCC 33970) TaxID=176299 RepID=Q7CYN6_AGRFC|nr:hypothetical protein Atu1727 [Agrobacterium fabrum str. C58]NMV71610.1 hypothetical protein [Agrobacterium fabrum]NSZ11798.1 hypothetical protein [Agrobacterium fabrum]NTB07521.1 hypothetical protein [Agrobacterium fabrum]NTE60599.1 hypothetical protein [Agrobacterium fabrum]
MKKKCGPEGRIFFAPAFETPGLWNLWIFKAGQIGGLTMKKQLAITKPSIEISRKPFNPSRIPILLMVSEKRTDRAYRGSITET